MSKSKVRTIYGRGEMIVLLVTGLVIVPIMIICGIGLSIKPGGVVGTVLGILVPLLTIGVYIAYFVGVRRKLRACALEQTLLESGRPAPATILQARDGSYSRYGGTMKYHKDIKLLLEVHPPDGEAFRAKAIIYDASISDSVQPSQTLLVKYDPNDTSMVAVDEYSFRRIASESDLKELMEEEQREETSHATLEELEKQEREH